MVFTDTQMGVNHAHCTAVVNKSDITFELYLQSDGKVKESPKYYTGRYHSRQTINVGSADSRADAIDKGKSKLLEIAPKRGLELTKTETKHRIGDKIVGRYQSENVTIETYVSMIIARCDGGNIYPEYKLSEV